MDSARVANVGERARMSRAIEVWRGAGRVLVVRARVAACVVCTVAILVSAASAQDFSPPEQPAATDAAAAGTPPESNSGGRPDFGNVRGAVESAPRTAPSGDPNPAMPASSSAPNPEVAPAGAEAAANDKVSVRPIDNAVVPPVPDIDSAEAATVESVTEDNTSYMTSSGGGVPRLDARIALARQSKGVSQLPLRMLGQVVEPGRRAELRWEVGESFDGGATFTPVTAIHGQRPGPTLCLTAAIHGDELNGIEVVRRVLNELKPGEVRGTVIGVPIVNLFGFARGTRYLPDRRDLNRYFPGSTHGSAGARIARRFFDEVVRHCDALVDFHTGSFARSNLPQVRADLTANGVVSFTRGFGAIPVLHSPGSRGMLRRAASELGIAAATFEVGAPGLLEPEEIDKAAQSIHTLMHRLGMTRGYRMWSEPQAVLYASRWVRADSGGMLFSKVELGDKVRVGQRLGKIVDPVRNREAEILSPLQGRVIGMALNQLVLPGFAAYHIGVERSERKAVEEAAQMPREAQAVESMEGDELNASGEATTIERTGPGGTEVER